MSKCLLNAMPGCLLLVSLLRIPLRSSIGRPQVFPVDFDEVERTEPSPRTVKMAADQTKNGQTGHVADDGFPVDDARIHRQLCDRLYGEGETIIEVFALPTD